MQKLPPNIRRQLTFFLEPKDAVAIEQVRKEFNPIQFELIKAHVTLCREYEIQDLEKVIENLLLLIGRRTNIFIEFGKIERFANGKGLLLPANNGYMEFKELRIQVLYGQNVNIRNQEPHITLMHPRNSTCNDEIFRQIEKIELPKKLEFNQISLIEQEGDGQWKTLRNFRFKN